MKSDLQGEQPTRSLELTTYPSRSPSSKEFITIDQNLGQGACILCQIGDSKMVIFLVVKCKKNTLN